MLLLLHFSSPLLLCVLAPSRLCVQFENFPRLGHLATRLVRKRDGVGTKSSNGFKERP